jgi:predicted RNA-binding protein with PIN domain
MTTSEKEKIQEAIKQADAIFALEGFEPTEQIRAIDAAVLAGRVTRTQATQEMVEYVKEHKTTDGFIESRAWA